MIEKSELLNVRKNFLWNALGSGIFAASSMLMLVLVNYVNGVNIAGKFSVAYAIAQMLYIVGIYGMNIFQMTDYKKEYDFAEYFSAKLVTTGVTVIVCIAYVAVNGRGFFDNALMVGLSLYLLAFSVAEVFQSQMFCHGRLDLSGKSLFYRTLISLIVFGLLLYVTKSVLVATGGAVLANIVGMFFWTFKPLICYEAIHISYHYKKIGRLIGASTPLFFSALLLTALTNAPKYFIDIYLDDYTQGIYGMIFIPVMVVVLLCGFIYKPLLPRIINILERNDKRQTWKLLLVAISIIIGIIVLGILLADFIGIDIMSFIFRLDLSRYINEIRIMVICSGIVAYANFINNILIAMRMQRQILGVSLCALIVSCVAGSFLIEKHSIMGALVTFGIGYMLYNILLTVFMIREIRRR